MRDYTEDRPVEHYPPIKAHPLEGRIYLELTLPGKKPRAINIEVSPEIARALSPLPKDHDNPIDFHSRIAAMKQLEERREVLQLLGRDIMQELHKLVSSEDPIRGYTPEEWDRMHKND